MIPHDLLATTFSNHFLRVKLKPIKISIIDSQSLLKNTMFAKSRAKSRAKSVAVLITTRSTVSCRRAAL